MILLLVMTDGRAVCLERTIPAAEEALSGPISRRLIHDDSGDPDYRAWLCATFPGFEVVGTEQRAGFAGAIRSAWAHVRAERFVFHLEDDFVITRPVDLLAMAGVLDERPELVQLALRRQPWNDTERDAGGIIECRPDAYDERRTSAAAWLEHRLFFTTNPSLYRSALCAREWPPGQFSEGRFTHELLEDPDVRFGFWGRRESGEWCEHIGHERVGMGY